MLLAWEELEHARQRLHRVGGVQRAKYNVTGFGRLKRREHRFLVAQLADEDHVRIFAHAARSPSANASRSRPISRWLTIDFYGLKAYSTGSSMLMMCAHFVMLMWSTIAAIVVLLPQPVTPHTRISPSFVSSASFL